MASRSLRGMQAETLRFRHAPRCQGVAVNLHELIQYVLKDLGPSLRAVWPELSLCAAIVLLLLARMIFPTRKASGLPYYITFLGAVAALWFLCLDVHSWPQLSPGQQFVRRARSATHLHRPAGAGQLRHRHAQPADALPGAVRHLHAGLGRAQRRRRHGVLRDDPGRDDRPVHHGLGQSRLDGLSGHRNGQRALLRAGRHPPPSPRQQRGRLEICRVRRGHRRSDAVRPQPAERRAGLGPPAHHGPAAGGVARPDGRSPITSRPPSCWCWAG